MGDLLTQLQDEVYMMSDLFGISIGVLQRDAPPLPLMDPMDPAKAQQREEFVKNAKEMALNLIQRAKRVESLIERLPGVNRTEPEQYLCLERLEEENVAAGEKLVQTYARAEELLSSVRQALRTTRKRYQKMQFQKMWTQQVIWIEATNKICTSHHLYFSSVIYLLNRVYYNK